MRLVILILFLTFFPLKGFSQCDDGWFTGKISGGYKFFSADYIYNLENHFSFGTGAGMIFDEKEKMFFRGDFRIRPFGHKILMPSLWFSYGYLTKENCGILIPEIVIELGNLAPVRFAANFGFGFFNGKKSFLIGVGAEF